VRSPVYRRKEKPQHRDSKAVKEERLSKQTVRPSCCCLMSKEVNNYKGKQTKKFRDDCVFLQERSVDRTSSQDKWSKNKSYTGLRSFFNVAGVK